MVKKCYNPFEKVCDGTGPETCKEFHETSCSTRYEEFDSNSGSSLAEYNPKRQNPPRASSRNNFRESDSSINPLVQDRRHNFANDVTNNTTIIGNMGKQLLGETKCEKIPVKLCGKGCRVVQKGEKCHNVAVDDLRSVPEERCELNPRKSCRNVSKLVPKLKPVLECSMVPKEFCALKYGPPRSVRNEQKSIWCLDET